MFKPRKIKIRITKEDWEKASFKSALKRNCKTIYKVIWKELENSTTASQPSSET